MTAAASAKAADVLVVRMLAAEARALRDGLSRFLLAFRERCPASGRAEGAMNLTPRERTSCWCRWRRWWRAAASGAASS